MAALPPDPRGAADSQPQAVFMFSAQGGQWPGMGRHLFEQDDCFRDALSNCDQEVRNALGWSPVEVLLRGDTAYAEPSYVQPLVTAVQIALTRLLRSWGIAPAAVIGLSLGEAAAAYAADVVDLETAMRVACSFARLTQRQSQSGRMILVHLSTAEAEQVLRDEPGSTVIGCELSPATTVLSGESAPVARLARHLQQRGVFVLDINMGFAFHTSQMAPLAAGFLEDLGKVTCRPGPVPLYSSVTGAVVPGEALTAAYWWRVLSRRAHFVSTIRRLLDDGYRLFVEVGPHPTLARFVAETAQSLGEKVQVVPTLQRGSNDVSKWPLRHG